MDGVEGEGEMKWVMGMGNEAESWGGKGERIVEVKLVDTHLVDPPPPMSKTY